MLYVSAYNSATGVYSITDTDDNSIDYCSYDELMAIACQLQAIGVRIKGVSRDSVMVVEDVVRKHKRFLLKAHSMENAPPPDEFVLSKTGEKLIKCTSRSASTIHIPPVKVIGKDCFKSLRTSDNFIKFIMPNTVEVIEDRAFMHINISPDSEFNTENVRHIGESAFCNMLPGSYHFEMSFPSVETIGERAFAIVCYGGNDDNSYPESGITDLSFGDKLRVISKEMCYEAYLLRNLHLGSGVVEIGEAAFSGCYSIDVIELPDSVRTIGDYAFSQCGFSTQYGTWDDLQRRCCTLKLPEGLVSVGERVFENCDHIAEIVFPKSLKSIGSYAFSSCSRLTHVVVPSNVTRIGNNAFEITKGILEDFGPGYTLQVMNSRCKVGDNFGRGREVYNKAGKQVKRDAIC